MSAERQDGGAAFPSRGGMFFYVPKENEASIREAIAQLDREYAGLSVRDWFATHATDADVDHWRVAGSTEIGEFDAVIPLSREAAKYAYADAMLAAREATNAE